MRRKILAGFLSLCMMVSLLPTAAFAETVECECGETHIETCANYEAPAEESAVCAGEAETECLAETHIEGCGKYVAPVVEIPAEREDANAGVVATSLEDEIAPVAEYGAEVNGVGCTTLADAFTAVNTAGKEVTIKLLSDLTIESDLNNAGKGVFNIDAGKDVTLDLNGKTIDVTDNSTGNFIVFYNYGEFTIKNGTVNLTATKDREWNAESAIVLNRGGVFNVESGTYTHNGGTDMAFVFDNSGNYYGDATTNINGGTLTSSYIAIRNRMEQNSHGASGKTYLNVSGGTISGTSRAIWAQAASVSETSPATGEINVTGGKVGLIDTPRSTGAESMTIISGGTVEAFKGEVGEFTVTGGVITGEVTMMTAAGEKTDYVVTEDGIYIKAVAKIGEDKYKTLQEAINSANGKTVTLLNNIELTEGVTIPADTTVTLDLGEYTITGTPTEAKAYAVITNKGELTINGTTGAFVCKSDLAGSTGYAVNTIVNSGLLTVNGGKIENNFSGNGVQIGYAIDNNSTNADSVVIIKGGEISASGSAYYDGIRLFCNNIEKANSVTVEEGKVSTIWMQNPSDGNAGKNTKDVKGAVSIEGGEVSALYLEPSTEFTASITKGAVGKVAYNETAEGRDLKAFITGGTFTVDPTDFLAANYEVKEDGSNFVVGKHELKTVAGTPATCTSTGIVIHQKCDFCGRLYLDGEVVEESALVTSKVDHTPVKDAAVAATCDKTGFTEGSHCDVCGEVLVAQQTVAAKGHSFGGWYTTKDATCAASGVETRVCACGESESKSIAATGNHSYDTDGKCTVCGNFDASKVVATPAPTVVPTTAPITTPTPEVAPETTPTPAVVPEAADTTITEVVANKEVIEAVKENVVVTEGIATVEKDTVEAVIEATAEEAPVVLPLAQATETEEVVNKAEVAAEALETVAEAEKDVVIELTDVTVKLDAEAVKAITEQADGETIEIRAVKTEHHTLTEAQQATLQNKETAVIVTAQIFSDGEYIGDFKGGKATIMLPFTPDEDKAAEDYKVYFIDEHGELVEVPAEYVDGYMVFTTYHFSDYVIIYEGDVFGGEIETVVPEMQEEESSFPILPIVIAFAVVAVCVIVIILKKRNS